MALVPQEMSVQATSSEIDSAIDYMTTLAVSPWSRAKDKELEVNLSECRIFIRDADKKFPRVGLFIWIDDKGLSVQNIVPEHVSEITTRCYNDILAEFRNVLLQPAADKIGASVVSTLPTMTLRSEIEPALFEKLQRFSSLANGSTRYLHPLDQRRWFDFLVSCHRDSVEIELELLREALVGQGWDSEMCEKLCVEFRFSQKLLEHNDNFI